MGEARIGFTGRRGGVSPPPFATLNLSRHVRDLSLAVAENRRRAVRLVGGDQEPVWGQLIHGTNVVWLEAATEPGPGPVADGLLTTVPNLTIAMTFADCVPIWLYHRGQRAGGMLHAGWRGTVNNIAGAGIAALRQRDADASGVQAVIGPSIGPCCYEVGDEVVHAVNRLDLGPGLVTARHLDLWETNRRLLLRAGVPAANITVTKVCTACRADLLFSHRGEAGRTGRNGGFFRISHD